MRDENGFDLWAKSYDAATLESYNSNTYPFAGYMKVIEKVYAEVVTNSYKSVLDIGFGTAFLTLLGTIIIIPWKMGFSVLLRKKKKKNIFR